MIAHHNEVALLPRTDQGQASYGVCAIIRERIEHFDGTNATRIYLEVTNPNPNPNQPEPEP